MRSWICSAELFNASAISNAPQHRRIHAREKRKRHPVPRRQPHQFPRRFRRPELFRSPDDLIQLPEQFALLIDRLPGITDDVREQDMRDLQLRKAFGLRRHVGRRTYRPVARATSKNRAKPRADSRWIDRSANARALTEAENKSRLRRHYFLTSLTATRPSAT